METMQTMQTMQTLKKTNTLKVGTNQGRFDTSVFESMSLIAD